MVECSTNELCCRSTTKIFVGNIKVGTSSEELRESFDQYGKVTEADVVGGYGFVVSRHFICSHCIVCSHGIVVLMDFKWDACHLMVILCISLWYLQRFLCRTNREEENPRGTA